MSKSQGPEPTEDVSPNPNDFDGSAVDSSTVLSVSDVEPTNFETVLDRRGVGENTTLYQDRDWELNQIDDLVDKTSTMYDLHGEDAMPKINQLLHDELHENQSVKNTYTDDDVLVVETEDFLGYHTIDWNRSQDQSVTIAEEGMYVLDGTDFEIETLCPKWRAIDKAQSRLYQQETETHASMTVGERNRGLSDI